MKELNDNEVPPIFRRRCDCEFEDYLIYSLLDGYEMLSENLGYSWWFPIHKGAKNINPHLLRRWGDPEGGERKNGWFMWLATGFALKALFLIGLNSKLIT